MENNDKIERLTTDKMLSYLALGATIATVLSYVYGLGFYSRLGVSISTIPYSIPDLAKEVFNWCPIVILVIFLSSLRGRDYFIVNGVSADEPKRDFTIDKPTRKEIIVAVITLCIMVFAVIFYIKLAYDLYYRGDFSLAGSVFGVSIIAIPSIIYYCSKTVRNRFNTKFEIDFFRYGSACLIFCFVFGWYQADMKMNDSKNLKLVLSDRVVYGKYINNLDRGVLLFNNERIYFYNWGDINRIEYTGNSSILITPNCFFANIDPTLDECKPLNLGR